MSEETKVGLLEKLTTRRDFLKLTGKGMAGVAASYSILALFGCSSKEEEVAGFALATGLLIADRTRCTGCQRCEIMCTTAHDHKVQPYISRIKVSENYNYGVSGPKISYWKEDGQYGNLLMSPVTCKQCREPFCGNACPVGAIYSDESTGARTVDKDKCIGCGTCTEACPWHLPTVDPETKVSTKCVSCGFCASNCPTGALKLIPWEDVKVTLRKHGYVLG